MKHLFPIPMQFRRAVLTVIAALPFSSAPLRAAHYEVGPSQRLQRLDDVRWAELRAGDVVSIHHKQGCYAEKFLVSGRGESWEKPIIVEGVPGPGGQLPCITGDGAIQTHASLDRWSGADRARYSESLYVVGISLRQEADSGPQFIYIRNLEITGAAPGRMFTAGDGTQQPYGEGVAGIRIINGSHIRVSNCFLHDIGGSGVFGKPNYSFPGSSTDIELLNNHFARNGVAGSYLYHNSYIESDGATYIGNLYESLALNAIGSHLKDRSAGTVVAYNRFSTAAARYIDLVEPEDGWSGFGSKKYYGSDFVYGNIFEARHTDSNFGSMGNLIHYGGDQGNDERYRQQTLTFYYNTMVVIANSPDRYKVGLFELECSSARLSMANNVILFRPETGHNFPEIDILASNSGAPSGRIEFGTNWISPNWFVCFPERNNCPGVAVAGTGNIITSQNNDPGLEGLAMRDYRPKLQSPLVGRAKTIPELAAAHTETVDLVPKLQYSGEQGTQARSNIADIGALAHSGQQAN